jgi:hypothetical protein
LVLLFVSSNNQPRSQQFQQKAPSFQTESLLIRTAQTQPPGDLSNYGIHGMVSITKSHHQGGRIVQPTEFDPIRPLDPSDQNRARIGIIVWLVSTQQPIVSPLDIIIEFGHSDIATQSWTREWIKLSVPVFPIGPLIR